MIASQAALYEEEVLQAHLFALRALREIMTEAGKPLSPPTPGATPAAQRAQDALATRRLSIRLKAATAILKIKPSWPPTGKPAISPAEATAKLACLVATAAGAQAARREEKHAPASQPLNRGHSDAHAPPNERASTTNSKDSP